MKLVLSYGGGSGYYPFTQKPIDYQPYRPVYLFRGPPPDAGFSYGLFEDEETNQKYYSELGLEPLSPFSGKPVKLLENLDHNQITSLLGDDLNPKNLERVECLYCGSAYHQNLRSGNPDKELYCHRCGGKLPKVETLESAESDAGTGVEKDPMVQETLKTQLAEMFKKPEVRETIEKMALKYNIDSKKAKEGFLNALRTLN